MFLNFFKMSYRAVMSGSGIAGMQREDVVATIVRLTGKKEAKDITCLYIGTAIYNDQRGAAQYLGLETAGCSVTHLPMDATKADAEVLFLADVILVSGGNTLFAVDRWQHLGIKHLFAEAGLRGAVLCGGSAGAICWFDSGHSDSGDPTSFRVVNPNLTDDGKANWEYIRVDGLGMFPGLMCPHYDQTQSNGVLRATDFSQMMQRHPGERGLGLDHFCALVTEGDGSYSVLSCPGKEGSAYVNYLLHVDAVLCSLFSVLFSMF